MIDLRACGVAEGNCTGWGRTRDTAVAGLVMRLASVIGTLPGSHERLVDELNEKEFLRAELERHRRELTWTRGG